MIITQTPKLNTPNFPEYIYSKIAASKILGTSTYMITRIDAPIVRNGEKYCNVHLRYPAGCFKTLKAEAFKRYFVESRKDRSLELKPERTPNRIIFSVPSARTSEIYKVKLDNDFLICTCKDYEIQKSLEIKTPTCKHCYAVLNYLGYSNLSDYLKAF